MPDIVYTIGNSLYLNITNRCTNECGFCIRNVSPKFNQQHNLWLDHEPTAEELIAAIGDPTRYDQIVFCGYGEPTIRLDIIKAVVAELKSKLATPSIISPLTRGRCLSEAKTEGVRIRLNTNGQANLFWGRNILPELKGLIDAVTISLNATNSENYQKRCNPALGDKAFPAVLDFIKESKKYISIVEISAVELPDVDLPACKKLAEELGVKLRLRPYYEKTYVK